MHNAKRDGPCPPKPASRLRSSRHGEGGLTLVELAIAMAVLAIALAGIIAAILNSMVATSLNRQLNVARNAAMGKIDEARARSYDAMKDAALNVGGAVYLPQPPPALPGTTPVGTQSFFEVADLAAPPGLPGTWRGGLGRITLDALAPNNEIMKIRVEITWQSERGVRRFDTTTIVTR